MANRFSPFSQKNIQICRCGTASCRGVLGPKPKKPVEEKSITSTILAGTKRKLQEVLNYGKGRSANGTRLPKKRKMDLKHTISAKALNAFAQSEAARERAEKEAHEHSRQVASRESRALKRSTPNSSSRRGRSAITRPIQSKVVKVTRHTTVSFQHKVSKTGALKAITKASKIRSAIRGTSSSLQVTKMPTEAKHIGTPTRNANTDNSKSDGDDDSPNITPASLRSASRKTMQLSPSKSSPARGRTMRCVNTAQKKDLAQDQAGTDCHDIKDLHPTPSLSRSVRRR